MRRARARCNVRSVVFVRLCFFTVWRLALESLVFVPVLFDRMLVAAFFCDGPYPRMAVFS